MKVTLVRVVLQENFQTGSHLIVISRIADISRHTVCLLFTAGTKETLFFHDLFYMEITNHEEIVIYCRMGRMFAVSLQDGCHGQTMSNL